SARKLKSSERTVGVHAEVPSRTAMCQRMLTSPRRRTLVLGAPGGRMWPRRELKTCQHVLGAHAEAKWSRSQAESLLRMGPQWIPRSGPLAGVADERALRTPRALQSLLPTTTRHLSLSDAGGVGILRRSLMYPLRGAPVAAPDESLLRR
ncbi:aak-1, partial [Symbiodinium sp. CCMP2456]